MVRRHVAGDLEIKFFYKHFITNIMTHNVDIRYMFLLPCCVAHEWYLDIKLGVNIYNGLMQNKHYQKWGSNPRRDSSIEA